MWISPSSKLCVVVCFLISFFLFYKCRRRHRKRHALEIRSLFSASRDPQECNAVLSRTENRWFIQTRFNSTFNFRDIHEPSVLPNVRGTQVGKEKSSCCTNKTQNAFSHHLLFPLAKCELSFYLFLKPRSNLDDRNQTIKTFPTWWSFTFVLPLFKVAS